MTRPSDPSAKDVDAAWQKLLASIDEIAGANTYDDVMSVLCKGARNLSGADGVTFVRREGNLCHYMDEDAVGPLWKGKRFPLASCISGWCMLHRQTAIVPDIYRDPRIPHDAYRPTFVRSMIMTPVGTQHIVAAIGAYWAEPHVPTQHAVTLFEALAKSTGSTLARMTKS
jgi:GAF domain-containing protein